ncbi:MAG TPA: AIPR family protein [Phenylobacterium sp.]|uniref:AIPR family protein n=1 Tax=Phenylobacterium sp. TaxID=1871053 RepID=UPI002F927935
MTLEEFIVQTQASVRSEVDGRAGETGSPYPYPEMVFTELVMEHMADIGMCFEPHPCHFLSKAGNANLRLSGYAVSEEADQLDLFVSLYEGADTPTPIPDAETKAAAEQCLRFLARSVEGKLTTAIDPANEAHELSITIQDCYPNLNQIRIYVLTDRVGKSKNFKAREVGGKTIKLEVMDIERLHRHWSEGKPRDELVVNFEEVCGGALPCVYVADENADYEYALAAIPGNALDFVYERYGARLLEANVRSFLSVTGKVNKGIRDTIRYRPERFMAYNNGIVVVADEAVMGRAADGSPGILYLKGMQIVNGGQTTASIYFTRKRDGDIDLAQVRVPAKIIVLKSRNDADEEQLIADISRYANSQNAVKVSDLSANKPFHVELEKLAATTYCPDGVGRWFYERAAGSYNVMLAREGSTPARLRNLKEAIPSARKITKTDLAKYLNAWDGHPEIVALGAQKNFERFMEALSQTADQELPDLAAYKRMIAKTILFRTTHRLTRPFRQVQAQLAAYVVALLAERIGERISLDAIWQQQGLSPAFENLISEWLGAAYRIIRDTGGERLPSEWVKKPECWALVRKGEYAEPTGPVREIAPLETSSSRQPAPA